MRRLWLIPVLAWLAAGFYQLEFQTDPLDLLPADLPEVRGLKWQQERLIDPDETLITISGTAEEAEAAAESLAAFVGEQADVGKCRWQRDLADNAAFVADMTAYLWLNGDTNDFAALTKRLEPEALKERLQSIMERLAVTLSPEEIARLSFDPCGLLEMPAAKRLLSGQSLDPFQLADGTFRVVRVQPTERLVDHWACIRWMKSLRLHVAGWKLRNPERAETVGAITGRPSFVAESASTMERDMKRAIPMTALLVGILFWLTHRRWRPVALLVALLTGVLFVTVAVGGWMFEVLNAISLGFAAILLGVCADYALVLYGEYRESGDAAKACDSASHGILWSAFTTAIAFASLVLGGLPGLGQLGLLVAVGVMVGAVVFVRFFLRGVGTVNVREDKEVKFSVPAIRCGLGVLSVCVVTVLVVRGVPGFTTSGDALQTSDSEAMAGVRQISQHMVGNADGWLVFVIADEERNESLHQRLRQLDGKLSSLKENRLIDGYMLPLDLVWRPDIRPNWELKKSLLSRTNEIQKIVLDAGFEEGALELQRAVFAHWDDSVQGKELLSTKDARELVGQASWAEGRTVIAAGWVDPATGSERVVSEISAMDGVIVASWGLLGESVWRRVGERLSILFWVLCPLVLVSLWFALGRWLSVATCIGALSLGLGFLLTVMNLAGCQWNIINVAALPVLLGLGVDYSIHLLLSRHRHEGSLERTWNATGRSILLCAATSLAAFGSLAFASNPVLSEFGRVCAVGVFAMWLAANLAVFSGLGREAQRITGPSSSYGATAWRLGLTLIRMIPRGVAVAVARSLTVFYARLRPERLAVVRKNLLPVADDAAGHSMSLFGNFGEKLVDLWRFEAGCSMADGFGEWRGWGKIQTAQEEGNGVLLVTVHLGNWELGSAAIKAKGMDLVVLSNPEPDPRLTEMREAARKRMGIETIIVGEDPFAFVEVIKRLREGAAVALLLDRPATTTASTVKLFGRPFNASIGPVELARASGAALLPVVVVREGDCYSAQVLGRVRYERAKLREPVARVDLTQELLRAFEPVLQHYPDQWYHFVPIWPEPS